MKRARRPADPKPERRGGSRWPAAKRWILLLALGGAFTALGWRVARGAPHPLEALDEFADHLRHDRHEEARALCSAALQEALPGEAFPQEVARFSVLSRVEGVRFARRASERLRSPDSPYEACARFVVPGGFEEIPVRMVDEGGWRLDAMRVDGRAFGPTDVPRSLCRRSRLR